MSFIDLVNTSPIIERLKPNSAESIMFSEPDDTNHKTSRALEIVSELQQKAANRRRSDQAVVSQEDLQSELQIMLPLLQQHQSCR